MNNKTYTEKTKLSIRVKTETKEELIKIANSEYRDLSQQVNMILDKWVESHLKKVSNKIEDEIT